MEHFSHTIDGWTDDDFRRVYDDAVAAAPPEGAAFVEVGVWLGKSLAHLAVVVANSGKKIALHAVDHFRGSPDESAHTDVAAREGGSVLEVFRENMRRGGVLGMLEIHACDSVAAAEGFADGSLDLVMIDATHTRSAVRSDLAVWWPKVKAGGTLAGHDWHYEAVKAAVLEKFGEQAVEAVGTRCWRVRKGE